MSVWTFVYVCVCVCVCVCNQGHGDDFHHTKKYIDVCIKHIKHRQDMYVSIREGAWEWQKVKVWRGQKEFEREKYGEMCCISFKTLQTGAMLSCTYYIQSNYVTQTFTHTHTLISTDATEVYNDAKHLYAMGKYAGLVLPPSLSFNSFLVRIDITNTRL